MLTYDKPHLDSLHEGPDSRKFVDQGGFEISVLIKELVQRKIHEGGL